MSKLGINTGTVPNDDTGDSLLDGAVKVNSNFGELYTLLGDGNTLSVGVVTAITAGSGIDVSSASGNVTVTNTGVAVTANIKADTVTVSGVLTATSFSGTVPSSSLSGALPALDGSALTGVIGSGSGIVVKHDGSTVGTAGTINFSTNLDVTAIHSGIVTVTASGGGGGVGSGGTWTNYDSNTGITTTKKVKIQNDLEVTGVTTALGGIEFGAAGVGGTIRSNGDATFAGIVTATSFQGDGSLLTRTLVTGSTSSITNNQIGNIDINGFKSYALMKVGITTAGWIRLYTDSTSRSNDVGRSVGIDPTPGSGVIAEVVTTGISTTKIISPFVMGGNMNDPVNTTIYASITNLSGTTQTITAYLTILKLEKTN
jgi:hypothetical protein